VPPRNAPPAPAQKGNEDVFLAITTIGPWINNADTKIGLLAAALTVLTGGALRQRPRVESLINDGVHLRGGIALATLALCSVAIVVAGVWLFRALRLGSRSVSRAGLRFLTLRTPTSRRSRTLTPRRPAGKAGCRRRRSRKSY